MKKESKKLKSFAELKELADSNGRAIAAMRHNKVIDQLKFTQAKLSELNEKPDLLERATKLEERARLESAKSKLDELAMNEKSDLLKRIVELESVGTK